MREPVTGLLKVLYQLTSGDVAKATRLIRRIVDQGFVLEEVERDIDASLDAIDARKRGAP